MCGASKAMRRWMDAVENRIEALESGLAGHFHAHVRPNVGCKHVWRDVTKGADLPGIIRELCANCGASRVTDLHDSTLSR